MTTIIGLKTNQSVFIGSDCQLTAGNLRLPFPYQKILGVGNNILIAGSGGLGSLQQMLKRSLRQVHLNKVITDDFGFEISPLDLAKEMADISFELNLNYKEFESFSYLIAGTNTNALGITENSLLSVCDDGSVLDVPNFYSCGSGMQTALGLLQGSYTPDMNDEVALATMYNILKQVHQSDIYTDDMSQVYCISEGVIKAGKLIPQKQSRQKKNKIKKKETKKK